MKCRDAAPSFQTTAIGIGVVCLVTVMSRTIDLTFMAGHVGSSAPAPAPLYLLFLWLLCIAPVLKRVRLSRNELLVIYSMVIAAGTIPSHEVVGFMIPHMASVHFNATPENEWLLLFHQHLPTWIAPLPKAAIWLAEGEDLVVPISAWAAPIAAWSFFFACAVFCYGVH